jgi:hypothetical protein
MSENEYNKEEDKINEFEKKLTNSKSYVILFFKQMESLIKE